MGYEGVKMLWQRKHRIKKGTRKELKTRVEKDEIVEKNWNPVEGGHCLKG